MASPKILIAIPCMDMVHTDFMISLNNLQRIGATSCAVTKSSLVYSARNSLTKQAIANGFDRILWLDSDMVFESDLLVKLSEHVDNGCEYVSGLYFKRTYPTEPVLYKSIEQRQIEDGLSTDALVYTNYPKDQLFEVAATGFGAVMMTTDLAKKVYDEYGLPFSPTLGLGEDLSFCLRAKSVGAKLYCDSSIKLKHIGLTSYDEVTYLSQLED